MPSSGLRTGGLGTGNAGDEDRGDVIDYLFAQVEASLGLTHVVRNTTADLMKIKRNGPEDARALIWSMTFSSILVLGCMLLFKLLQRWIPALYAGSTSSWWAAAGAASGSEVVAVAGLDALMLADFHALCRRLLGSVGPVAMLVLCPLHFVTARAQGGDELSKFGLGVLLSQEEPSTLAMRVCWAHAAAVWFVVLVSLQQIGSAQERFLQHRFEWLKDIPPPRSKTLMVEGIPPELRSDALLEGYFARLLSAEAVERVYVVRKTRELNRLLREAEALEHWLPQSGGNTCCPLTKESVALTERRLAHLRIAIKTERLRIEEGVQCGSAAVCSASGFVTFTTRRWCRLASREQFRADASELTMSMPPDPSDVLYKDLAKDPRERAGLEWVARLLTFAVVCLWMPVVVTISCMTDLNKLRQHVYFFDFVCGKFPFVQATLEGVLATAALQMFMSMLPTVLMCIVHNFCTLKSGAWAQLELQNRYIVLQVVFVLLVTAINQTVLASLQTLIKSPQKIFPFLADNLPDNSHFYAGYLALGCASLAGNLLRLGVLPRYLAQRAAGSTPETAQQVAEEQALGDAGDGMGARMARAALMVTIALVFCTCMPLISLIAWVYFALGARTFRFLSVYLEARRPDLGGAFWLAALRSLLCAVVLFVFLMVGILSRVGNKPAAALAAASLFALAFGSVRLEYLRGDSLPFEVVVEADSRISSVAAAERPEGAPKAALYCQQECFPDNP